MWIVLLIWLVVIVQLIKNYLKHVYGHWKRKGVPMAPYKYIFGHMKEALFLQKHGAQLYAESYRKYEGLNYVGFYRFFQPVLVLRSPELIKDVLQKNFSSFHDNDIHIDENNDMILARNPFILKGDRWKETRTRVSPSFSNSKVKSMMPLLDENCKKMLKYIEENEVNGEAVEVKELASKLTYENVASCAFGLNGASFTNPDGEFSDVGKKLTSPTFWNGFKNFFIFNLPTISAVFKIKLFTNDITHALRSIVNKTLCYRKANNIIRNDFLDDMIGLRTKIADENDFNEDDIVAQAGTFLLDGFETSSIAIGFTLYEIAAAPTVQSRLRAEVDDILKKHNGQLSYEAIQEMTYLDCVFKENLRKNVPLMAMQKWCTTEYKLPPLYEDGTGPEPTIEAGTSLIVPVYALHHDEKHFPEPERFDPDRFSDENIDSIRKWTYLPFGDGPRICLGMRFGILQSKAAIASVIANYELHADEKTNKERVIEANSFMLTQVGGLWVQFRKRSL